MEVRRHMIGVDPYRKHIREAMNASHDAFPAGFIVHPTHHRKRDATRTKEPHVVASRHRVAHVAARDEGAAQGHRTLTEANLRVTERRLWQGWVSGDATCRAVGKIALSTT